MGGSVDMEGDEWGMADEDRRDVESVRREGSKRDGGSVGNDDRWGIR